MKSSHSNGEKVHICHSGCIQEGVWNRRKQWGERENEKCWHEHRFHRRGRWSHQEVSCLLQTRALLCLRGPRGDVKIQGHALGAYLRGEADFGARCIAGIQIRDAVSEGGKAWVDYLHV